MRTALTLALLSLAGCYRTVGPVVVDAHDGHVTRCDLVVSRSILLPGDDSFAHCKDESGKDVDPPKPSAQ